MVAFSAAAPFMSHCANLTQKMKAGSTPVDRGVSTVTVITPKATSFQKKSQHGQHVVKHEVIWQYINFSLGNLGRQTEGLFRRHFVPVVLIFKRTPTKKNTTEINNKKDNNKDLNKERCLNPNQKTSDNQVPYLLQPCQ